MIKRVAITPTDRKMPADPTSLPTGTVTFSEGNTLLGTVHLDESAQARLTIKKLAKGSHTILIQFSGDSNFDGGTVELTVKLA